MRREDGREREVPLQDGRVHHFGPRGTRIGGDGESDELVGPWRGLRVCEQDDDRRAGSGQHARLRATRCREVVVAPRNAVVPPDRAGSRDRVSLSTRAHSRPSELKTPLARGRSPRPLIGQTVPATVSTNWSPVIQASRSGSVGVDQPASRQAMDSGESEPSWAMWTPLSSPRGRARMNPSPAAKGTNWSPESKTARPGSSTPVARGCAPSPRRQAYRRSVARNRRSWKPRRVSGVQGQLAGEGREGPVGDRSGRHSGVALAVADRCRLILGRRCRRLGVPAVGEGECSPDGVHSSPPSPAAQSR